MNNVFKVFFYPRKNYVNKNGEVSIRVLLSLNGERTQFTSELTIPLEMILRVFIRFPKEC